MTNGTTLKIRLTVKGYEASIVRRPSVTCFKYTFCKIYLNTKKMDSKKILTTWIFMADSYYLSARLAMLHGLFPVGLHNAATAIEMYLKCALQLMGEEYKITHNLLLGFEKLKISLAPELITFICELNDAYTKEKYPDSWSIDVKWYERLNEVDILTLLLRNHIISLVDEKAESIDILNEALTNNLKPLDNITTKHGVLTLKDVFLRSNNQYSKFKFFKKG